LSELTSHPLLHLGEDDLNMVTAFILASGSIKDLARKYGVSYPTMRARLDELIARVSAKIDNRPSDPLRDYLADLIARGQVSFAVARRIRDLHDEALKHQKRAKGGERERAS